ncbi:MAG: LamG domain-containing protein, partial [Planctomycetes bacterium]|nr:LamG domain-containing protein [Planctomycetota bacterium]
IGYATSTASALPTLTDYQVPVNPFVDKNFIDNTGLVGSWHFSEGAGTTATDSTDYRNNGTISPTATGPTWVDGRFGNGLSFDGTDDSVNIPDSATLDITGQISIEAWINPANLSGNKMIVGKRSDWAVNGCPYDLMQINDGITFYIYGASIQSAGLGGAVSANVWQHIAATYDGANMKVYINGVERANNPTNIAIPTNNAFVGIGRRSDGAYDYFVGLIDEVRIYNRALSASEILTRYNGNAPKVKGDYADVRFTNSDGTQELNYWQETVPMSASPTLTGRRN